MKTLKSCFSFFALLFTTMFLFGAVAQYFEINPYELTGAVLFIHLFTPVTKWAIDAAKAQGFALDLVISDTTYAGTFASYFWLPATFSMDTLRKGVVYVQDGIKKAHTIGRIDFSNPLQPRQSTPTSSGTFTVDGRVLTPADMMCYVEFNPRDYEQHWLAESLSPTLLARELPVTAENYMMQIALNRVFEQLELGIWQGSTGYSDEAPGTAKYQIQFFDGFIKKFLADVAVTAVGSPVTLTASNIIAKFDLCIDGTKKALLANPARYQRLKFLVSVATEQLYQTALTSLSFKGTDTTEKGVNRYKGYDIVPLAGMPDNTIVFTEALMDVSSNLYLGMNSTEDNNLQLQRLQNNSELFFFKGLMKYDVQYGFSDQVVLYTTLVTSDFA